MNTSNRMPDMTRSAILAILGAQGPTSRADIARALNISPPLVTQNTKTLIAEGLIEELTTSRSQGGRPARLIGLTAGSRHAIGIKVAPNHVTLVEVGIDGKVLRGANEPFDAASRFALKDLATITETFINAGSDDRTILGIGVGTPGTVDSIEEGSIDSTQLGWSGMPVGDYLRESLNLPVLADNNVNALAIAESLYGRAHGHESALVVTVGTGIGSSIIYEGRVLRGFRGGAGEIGHFPYIEDGLPCQCGARGCVETLITESALIKQARDAGIIATADIQELAAKADSDDAAAQTLFAQAGHVLGRTLSAVVNFLSPEIVIILGEGAASWSHWSLGFEGAFRESLVPHNANIPVYVETWQDDRWAQGAATLVLATPFDTRGQTGEQGRLVRERLSISKGR